MKFFLFYSGYICKCKIVNKNKIVRLPLKKETMSQKCFQKIKNIERGDWGNWWWKRKKILVKGWLWNIV